MLAQNYSSPPFTYKHSLYPQHLDDIDAASLDDTSFASSPRSTHSSLSHRQTSAISTEQAPFSWDIASSVSIPRQPQVDGLLYLPPSSPRAALSDQLSSIQRHHPDLMQSDSSWLAGGHYMPKSVGRLSHHRESSLSSLGSAGPASPYSHNTANPQIAVTDSASDGFADMSSQDNSYYQLAKTLGPAHDGLYASYHPFGDGHGSGLGYQSTNAAHRFKGDRSLLPAPEMSTPFGSSRSHPASVASSIAGDSPATPSLGEPEDDRRRKAALTNSVPKLDRTMTDVYSDELYNPNFSITSATSPHVRIPMSPQHDVFSQRLHAANNQHLSAHSPVSTSSRSRSPFRHGSPLAPVASHEFGASSSSAQMRFNTAQQMRDQQKAEHDAQARHQMVMKSEPETPKTISPKDAILEFHEPEGEANFPLFPPQDSTFLYDHISKQDLPHIDTDAYHRSSSGSANGDFRFAAAQLTSGIQVPQQYPFIAHPRLSQDSPPRLSSTESSLADSPRSMAKPSGATADGGTYTCTYHGCSLRFETPALLQKHKREGHRQAQGLSPTHRPEGIMSAGLMTQAGPHRCDRINPSTGKSCNTVFSRPYDLTRHEDTIHNARKQKVRCNMCTEEKTFSRADALTRHFRVCHPDVDFPGKHRRRGAH